MRIAVAQTPGVRLDQWRDTLALIEDLIGRAAGLRADLVVLPECAWPAYCLGSKPAYFDARHAGMSGPDDFLARVRRIAQERRIAVCTGYVAEEGDRLFNAGALIARDGRFVGAHRKCFLWAFDRDCFTPGQRIEPLDADFGRVGVLVCADARLPEVPATLAARGAQLILQPTGWVNAGTADAPWNPQPDFLIPARAAEHGIPVASASKWGAELDTTFVGSSLICDGDGHILAQCGPAETTVIAAEVEPRVPRCPQMTAAQRNILLSTEPPTLPRPDVRPLELLPLPPGKDPMLARAQGRAAWQPVTGPDTTEIDGIRIGVLGPADSQSFAPGRCLALQGVHAIIARAAEPSMLLQARACENRVFVVTTSLRGWSVIDLRGLVVHQGLWPAAPLTLDVAATASKTVAPHTDMLAGRRPAQYAFTCT